MENRRDNDPMYSPFVHRYAGQMQACYEQDSYILLELLFHTENTAATLLGDSRLHESEVGLSLREKALAKDPIDYVQMLWFAQEVEEVFGKQEHEMSLFDEFFEVFNAAQQQNFTNMDYIQ